MQLMRTFTAALATAPCVGQNQELKVSELCEAVGFQCDEAWFNEEVLTFVENHAAAETGLSEPGAAYPAQILLQAAFFGMRDLQLSHTKAEKKLLHAQQTYQSATDKMQAQTNARKKRLHSLVEKLDKDEAAKEVALARRNQINRFRKGVKMARAQRSEEGLPEALSKVPGHCAFGPVKFWVLEPRRAHASCLRFVLGGACLGKSPHHLPEAADSRVCQQPT